MSWQTYVDNTLLGSRKVDKAAIFSAKGDSTWATSPTPQEVQKITAAFNDTTDVATNGLFLESVKYNFLSINPEKNIIQASNGTDGFTAAKTNQAVILGHHTEGMAVGCHATVENFAQYLMGVGY
ncbi:profilin, required for normal timing of actin polymerization in response to thermal stress, partial [Haplosporangium sp. Z 27]